MAGTITCTSDIWHKCSKLSEITTLSLYQNIPLVEGELQRLQMNYILDVCL
jgi:hypothetical protein